MRRLVALALVERVAHQLAQQLAVGRRVRFDQLRERGVAFLEQALAPVFGAVQQRGFLARGLAAGVERVADRAQRLVVLAPHLLGQECHLPLARDVRGDAPGVGDVRVQVVGHRQLRQLRRRQGDQALREFQHVQRVPPLLAAAGAEEFTGVFVSAAHAVRHSDQVARIVH